MTSMSCFMGIRTSQETSDGKMFCSSIRAASRGLTVALPRVSAGSPLPTTNSTGSWHRSADYSARNATIGSTRLARRAGIQQANDTAAVKTNIRKGGLLRQKSNRVPDVVPAVHLLFRAQRNHRIDPAGASCRNPTSHSSRDQHQQNYAEIKAGIDTMHFVEHSLQ